MSRNHEQGNRLLRAAATTQKQKPNPVREFLRAIGRKRWQGVSKAEHRAISSKGGKACHANRRKAKGKVRERAAAKKNAKS
jgi:hypothetical protein